MAKSTVFQTIEKAIQGQEIAIRRAACRFSDETETQFNSKVAQRLHRIEVILRANELPGINAVCPPRGEVIANGYSIRRVRVDEIDNVKARRI